MVTTESSSKNPQAYGWGTSPQSHARSGDSDRTLSLALDDPTIRLLREVLAFKLIRRAAGGGEQGVEEAPPPPYAATQSPSNASLRSDVEAVRTIPGLLVIMAVELVIAAMYTFQSLILWSAGGGAGVLGNIVVIISLVVLWVSFALTRVIQKETLNLLPQNKLTLYVRWKLMLLAGVFGFLLISIPLASSIPVSFLQFDLIKSVFAFYGSLGLLLGLCRYFKKGSQRLRLELCLDWEEPAPQDDPETAGPSV